MSTYFWQSYFLTISHFENDPISTYFPTGELEPSGDFADDVDRLLLKDNLNGDFLPLRNFFCTPDVSK